MIKTLKKDREERNLDVPRQSMALAYLQLAKEEMDQIEIYNLKFIKDIGNGDSKILNPLYKFFQDFKKHIQCTECFIKTNYAGKFCLKCGIKVEDVLYCDTCDKEMEKIKTQIVNS